MPLKNKMRVGRSRIEQVTGSDHNAQIVECHFGQKQWGPGNPTVLSYWLGSARGKHGLSSKAEPDPKGYRWRLTMNCALSGWTICSFLKADSMEWYFLEISMSVMDKLKWLGSLAECHQLDRSSPIPPQILIYTFWMLVTLFSTLLCSVVNPAGTIPSKNRKPCFNALMK